MSTHQIQQFEWFEMPGTSEKAKVIDQILAVNCLCNKHPAYVALLDNNSIVVICETRGFIFLKKPDDWQLFKKHMTNESAGNSTD